MSSTESSAERERAEEEAEEAARTTSETSSSQTTSTKTSSSPASSSHTSSSHISSSETSTTETEGQAAEGKQAQAAEEAECGRPKTAPILLEGKDASTYDPSAFPASGYAHPALALDGNASTAWTAAPAPGLAPKVQAGLLIDLRRPRKIGKVALISRTLGMTIRVYGTTERKPPKSIDSKRWIKLSGVHVVEQRSSVIKLEHTPKIRQLLVWVLRAPEVEPLVEGEAVEESAAVNELALYEPNA